jgi:Tol biopolymer transport system component
MLRRSHIFGPLLAALALAAPAFASDTYGPGSTFLLSRDSGLGALPAQSDGNSDSSGHAVSGDGRFVAFVSGANDLGAGDDHQHVYVRDGQTGAVTLIDRAGPGGAIANDYAYDAAISRDGSRVCFSSAADNLIPGVGKFHVYVANVATGAIVAADRATGGALGNQQASHCALSADGGVVAFESGASNLGAANAYTHVYARVLGAGTTQLVDSYNGTTGDRSAYQPSINATGLIVAFESGATNLLGPGGDTNAKADVYVRSLVAATPVLASRANGGGGAIGDGDSREASLSDDGNVVAFSTRATNLGDGDNDSTEDVHVRNVVGTTTVLVSRAEGAGGAKGNHDSYAPTIAGDASAVAFQSEATNIGGTPGPGVEGLKHLDYLRTLAGGHTTLINRASGANGAVSDHSPDVVALDQHAAHAVWAEQVAGLDPLANGIFSEVYERDLSGAYETRLVSRPQDASGRPAAIGDIGGGKRAVSADGRFVAFRARLAVAGVPTDVPEVFVRDTLLGTTRLVSRASGADGAPADGESYSPAISADGTKVAFISDATNLTADGTIPTQVYVRDLVANTTTLVSTGPSGPAQYGASEQLGINQDGSKVAFITWSPNLVAGDTNNRSDVFVRDMASGAIVNASLATAGTQLDSDSHEAALSADGTRVGFVSSAGNTGDGASAGDSHVYVRDLAGGTLQLVDRKADGSPGDNWAYGMSMSADGNRFAFESRAKLTPEAVDGWSDVFVRDVAAGTTVMASTAPDGAEANKQAFIGAISLDGTHVAFYSPATNLPAGSAPEGGLYERALGSSELALVSARDGSGAPAASVYGDSSLNADGSCVAFRSADSSLGAPSYAGDDIGQLWMRVTARECPLQAPDTTLTSGPDGSAKVREAYSVFAYKADESNVTFACSLDDAPAKPCGDTFHTGKLRDGVHRFSVAATDRAGNTDPTPVHVTFTVGVPPRITNLRLDKRSRLVFNLSEKATVRVRLARSGRAHSAKVSKLTIKRSRKGRYRATGVATDAGGNRSAPKRKSFDVRGAK